MRKEIALAKNILVSNFKDVSFPYKLNYCLTYKCNSRCLTCDIWKKKSKNELTIAEINKFFERSNKFSWMDITGGELFLRPEVIKVVQSALANCKNLYHLHIASNSISSKLTVKRVKEILDLKPKKFTLTLSLDGPPGIHDHIRGIKDNWKSVMESFRELKQYQNSGFNGFKIYFGFTLSRLNLNKFEETIQAVKQEFPDVDYKDFHMNVVHISDHYYSNTTFNTGLTDNKEEFLKQIESFRIKKKKSINPIDYTENKYLKYVQQYIRTSITPMECKSLASSVFLDPYGNIFPCSIWDKKIANIRDFNYDLKLLLANSNVKQIRQEIKEKKCPNCWTPCEAYQSIFGGVLKIKK